MARDLIVLIDTSGSMGGEPLAQAAHVVGALLDTLDEGDRIEMIEFSSRPRRWKRRPVQATEDHRRAARQWVAGLRAGGGTEMRTGILEALAPLSNESQRQVILITDGYIGFEREIVAAIGEGLPTGCRVHTVGVGHGVNRSLTEAAARAGRGLEVIIAPGEDPERAAARLVARTDAPCLVNLKLEGDALLDHAPRALPDVFAGSPVVIPVRLAIGGGTLRIHANGGDEGWSHELKVEPIDSGTGDLALARCHARERVADLEVERAMGRSSEALDAEIKRLGLEFQISTRLTSWVAISDEATVDPTEPTRAHEVPQSMVAGLSLHGLGLRAPTGIPVAAAMAMPQAAPAPASVAFMGGATRGRAGAPKAKKVMRRLERASDADAGDDEPMLLEAPKSQAGLFGRVADGIRDAVEGLLGDRSQPESSAPTGVRVTLWTDDALILEFSFAAEVTWEPKMAFVTLADGTRVEVEIDVRRTTRHGSIAAGTVVRLALALESKLSSKPVGVDVHDSQEGDDARWSLRIDTGGV